ncbi:MAG: DUF4349 domain-containing protein [Patescibacteria group bacterium]|jgi:hypothetical protein
MTEAKETMKAFGKVLRSINPKHQTALRRLLSQRLPQESTPRKTIPFRHLFFLGAWSMTALLLVLITRPNSPSNIVTPAISQPREYAEDTLTLTAGVTGGSPLADKLDQTASAIFPGNGDVIVNYEDTQGSMLETTTRLNIMTTEKDAPANIIMLFSSLGGHVSTVATRTAGWQTITGFVPSKSYPTLKDNVRNMVRGNRYMSETLQADDLIPQAINIESNIADATASIDALNKQLLEARDEALKTSLNRQLTSLETKLERYHKSLTALHDRVDFMTVTIGINEIPAFWKVKTADDLQNLVAGFEEPSVFQQCWINVLTVFFRLLQVLSVTFWLFIPLGIWLLARKREHRTWQELE